MGRIRGNTLSTSVNSNTCAGVARLKRGKGCASRCASHCPAHSFASLCLTLAVTLAATLASLLRSSLPLLCF
jgi:hypothetical protein